MESIETFESPGKYLKAMRESQGLSLNDVAHATKIREPVLVALEEDRCMNLPAIYVKSFLSSYAECLGVDASEVIVAHQKCADKLSVSKDRELKRPSPLQSKRISLRLLTISVCLVLLMGLIGFALFMLLR